MTSKPLSRLRGGRLVGVLAAAALAAGMVACGAPEAAKPAPGDSGAAIPDKPSSPQTINIIDVAGNLQLSQGMLDDFTKAHPDIVAKFVTTKATAPELAPKIKAEQDAGRLDIDMVLTGTDGLAAGISQNLWYKLTPDYNSKLPKFNDIYTDDAKRMSELGQGFGILTAQMPAGPLIMYNPKTVTTPPTTTDELLTWAKAHPKKFEYARPANSGPGRTMLMGLPYILGDSNPKDPKSWDKTWAYLADMAAYQPAFPGGTTQTMKDLANGTVDIVATVSGWDVNTRALGTVPADFKIGTLKGFHWVMDAHYAVIPKGVDKDKMSAILNYLKFAMEPKEQAHNYTGGYFYPGPAVKGVTLDMAPPKVQEQIKQFGRPEYDDLIKNNPKETSLPADAQVEAFSIWDQKVGSVAKK
jgi:putative spermidine/putrescine transport system substrate-binding protein